LADEGCAVALCARNGDQVAAAVAELERRGVRAFGRAADAGDPESLRSFVAAAADALGGLDVYVANASGALGRGNDEAAWRVGVEVDILGTVHGCEAAVPHLEAAGGGAIVVVSTVSAVEIAAPRRAYNSVKAALHPYVKSLARDLGPSGIRANIVSPGQIFFEGGVWDIVRQSAPDRFEEAVARNPLGRLGTPEEVAATVVFAASPRASFMSGANLVCDGARTQTVF
jgi:3-oxoacyl-[acyl-carrier protein] reductase